MEEILAKKKGFVCSQEAFCMFVLFYLEKIKLSCKICRTKYMVEISSHFFYCFRFFLFFRFSFFSFFSVFHELICFYFIFQAKNVRTSSYE